MRTLPRKFLAEMRRRPVRSCLIAAVVAVATYVACWQIGTWRHFLEARRASERGEFSAAWEELQPCLRGWPGSASTQFLAARTARRAGKLQDAQVHLARCQQLGAPAENVILEKYLLRAVTGELAEVEAKLLAFLDKDHPDSVLILEVLSQQRMNDFRLDEARSLLDRWLLLKPDDREAYLRLGWVQERLGLNAAAIIQYEKVLELAPEQDQRNGDPVRLRLAELLLDQAQPLKAEQHVKILRERLPDNLAVALAGIRCRHLVGKSAEAAELLDKLMRAQPPDARLLLERARLYLESARPDKAEPLLRDAAKLSPHNRQIVFLLAQCLKNLKKKEAEVYESRLKEIRADEKKMRELMQELMRSPKDAWLHFQIGQLFLRNGFVQDGERSFLTGLRCDPEHEPTHQALAAHYEKIGQPERAAMHRRPRAKGNS